MSSNCSFPLKKETKIDMQNQRAMIKVILKLKNNYIAVGSHGAVISIWNPDKKKMIQAWRAKGMVTDLLELDNNDLIASCNGNNFENYISAYKYYNNEHTYKCINNISCNSMLSALVKIDDNKFICGTMDNTLIIFFKENNGSYKMEKNIKLEEKEDSDCIYSLIKLSNGNFISTGFSLIKLIDSSSFKIEKAIDFSEPSCLYEDSKKHIWTGNSPGNIIIIDSELNKLKTINAHKFQINKFTEFNNNIISASTDFKMKIWNINSFECLQTINGYGEVTALCLFSEGCLVTVQGIPQTDDIEDYDESDLLQFLVFYEK